MKKRILLIFLGTILVFSIPISILSIGIAIPSQFNESFYGEIAVMHKTLKNAKRQKIVLIGNSAIAFGSKSNLLQNEFPSYDVVNFGLYGTIGTKAMIEWSKPYVQKGDIIIVVPEPYSQTSSLYFSGKEVWRAIDSDLSLFSALPSEEKAILIGSYPNYLAEKYSFFAKGEKPKAETVYSKKAFEDSDGNSKDYMLYERPYNIMVGGYDAANLPDLSKNVFGSGFISFLNNYSAYISNKGAKLFYGFCALNSLCVKTKQLIELDAFYDYLKAELSFPILGHPEKYLLDYRYFYDNNVHTNTAGSFAFTDLLAEDLKIALGITSKNSIDVPLPPEIPKSEFEDGDNSNVDKFVYEKASGPTEDYYRITKLNDKGEDATALIVPSSYNGLPIREFTASTFANNKIISRIVLPKNIRTIHNLSFNECSRLSELIFSHDSILGINAGIDFLKGADNCFIYLKKSVSIADCSGGWDRYQNRVRYY